MSDPDSFGWVSNLTRWSSADAHDVGNRGPLPPPRARNADPTEHELYQGLADGWLHGTVGASLSSFFSEPRTRKELYVLFEKMDMTDFAGSFLDLISEDATLPDVDEGKRIWCTGPDAIVAATEAMFKRLNTEDEITALTRDLAKFGDLFDRLVYRSGVDGGVRRVIPTPPLTITRKEDKEGNLQGYLQVGKKFRNENSEVSYPWDFAHFRIRGRDRRYPYGTSLLHNAIRPWKQCLAGGMRVMAAGGWIPIKDIRIGDIVMCFDAQARSSTLTRVTAAMKTGCRPTVTINTENQSLTLTADHPVMIYRDGGYTYVAAGSLEVATGARLVQIDDWSVSHPLVTSVVDSGEQDVYDLTVESEVHNFVAEGLVVHNCVILDDWAIGYQIQKHPDQNLILLDVGSASDAESAEITRRFGQRMKKHVLIDPAGTMGRNMGQRHDPSTPLQNMILPIRSGSATSVQKLAGSNNATDIVPLKLAIHRFFSAVRAPKEYFGFGDDGSTQPVDINPKATLTNQSVRYCRVVKRTQQSVRAGYRYLAELNLMLMMSPQGPMNPEVASPDLRQLDFRLKDNDFQLNMGKIGFLDELEQLEVEQTRQQVAIAMMELGQNNPAVDILAWTDYIMREIVKVPDDELDSIIRTDIEMQHIDNMSMGLLPTGEPVPEAPPQPPAGPNGAGRGKKRESRVYSAMLRRKMIMDRMIVRPGDRRATANRSLNEGEKRVLSECIQHNPNLRKLIYLSKRLHEKTEQNIPYMGVLPNNELIQKGYLADTLTEEAVQEMLSETDRSVRGDVSEMDRISLADKEEVTLG